VNRPGLVQAFILGDTYFFAAATISSSLTPGQPEAILSLMLVANLGGNDSQKA
jgi:hypothetical protein